MTLTLPTASPHTVKGPLAAGAVVVGSCVALAAFDPVGGPTLCPFKAMTGLDCPGCGITRATHQLLNGHLFAALDLNVLVVVVVPLFAWFAFAALTRWFGGPSWRMPMPTRRWLTVATVAVVLFGVARNLPMEPFHWLGTA